jgi:DNA mismatch endonuclease, patch repair protein
LIATVATRGKRPKPAHAAFSLRSRFAPAPPLLGASQVDVDPKRSALMARIRSSDTQPELAVRRSLHAMGFRFRLHRRDLPGRPDLVLPRHKLVIFVHGCFWHQHPGCRLASSPKSRQSYWAPKLAGNVERDRRNAVILRASGWRVETVWECDARKPEILAARLAEIIETCLIVHKPSAGTTQDHE